MDPASKKLAITLGTKVGAMSLFVALGIAAIAGVLVGLILPHGPATQSQTLLVLFGALIVGLLTGLALPSRWVMLVVPVAHLIAIELVRTGSAGQKWLDEAEGVWPDGQPWLSQRLSNIGGNQQS